MGGVFPLRLPRDLADAEVMRHVGRGAPLRAGEADVLFDRALAHWREHGFGWRSARARGTGEWVGFFVLNYVGAQAAGVAPDEVSVGWWVARDHWGHGYAKEGAEAMCTEAFDELRVPRLLAFIQPTNVRSVAVARAIGMRFCRSTRGIFDEPLGVHVVSRPG